MSYISAITQGNNVIVWERSGVKRSVIRAPAEWSFYVEHEKGNYQNMFGKKLTKLTFKNRFEFEEARKEARLEGFSLYDSDITPDLKYVSRNYINAEPPNFNVSFYDIEVDVDMTQPFKGALNPIYPVVSIALMNKWENKTYIIAVPPPEWDPEENPITDEIKNLATVILCHSERELLNKFLDLIEDTDCLVGYNSEYFDDPYITRRVASVLGEKAVKRLCFPEGSEPRFKEMVEKGQEKIKVEWSGRTQADYLQLIKKFEPGERQSYKLASVAQDYLPHMRKLTYRGSLEELYREDFVYFIRYNIRDTEILDGLEEKLGYIKTANGLRMMSTGYMSHIGGTVKLADLAVRNFCWYERNKMIVPDYVEKGTNLEQAEGATVLDPVVGFHRNISNVDVTSLYPSNIMATNISPEKLIGQFRGDKETFLEIHKASDKILTLVFEDGNVLQKPSKDWPIWFKENNYCVTGFGTVFNMDGFGIFPSILQSWFKMRKDFQAKKKQASKQEDIDYYDRLQYIYKIKLNSFYGSLLNSYFRFYDYRLGSSTTGNGREILYHQCSYVNYLIKGEYSMDAGAVIAGDTDSSYFLYPDPEETDIDKIVKYVDKIGEDVNKSFPEFLKKRFFVNDNHCNFIKSAREIVATGGIFVTKKRYILNVVDKEGKRKEHAKVMGLDIKKSNLPHYVQERLTDWVIRYIKGESWTSLENDLLSFKHDVRNNSIMDLGIPKGVNKVEYYTEQYRQLGVKARLPGHVAASIMYNIQRDNFKSYSFPQITSGSKIRVFKLKQKVGKFKSIALPSDLEEIPEWFEENVVLSMEEHIKSLIDNPLQNILDAVNKRVPTEQTQFLNTFLEF